MAPEELARAWVTTFNDGDFAANRDLIAADGWFGITVPNSGTDRDANERESRAWKAAFPDARGEITRLLVNGNDVAMEIEWVGTNSGSLMGAPPTNKAVRVNASVFLTARDGEIARLMHYFDLAGCLTQLGMMPQ